MNWEVIGATGEWAGALAVVITLVYLAIQIRQTNRSMSDNSVTQYYVMLHELIGGISDPNSGPLLRRGTHEPGSLSPDEREQFNLLMQNNFVFYEYAWRLTIRGALDEALTRPTLDTMIGTLRTPGGEQWWQKSPVKHDEAFTDYVNKRLSLDA